MLQRSAFDTHRSVPPLDASKIALRAGNYDPSQEHVMATAEVKNLCAAADICVSAHSTKAIKIWYICTVYEIIAIIIYNSQ